MQKREKGFVKNAENGAHRTKKLVFCLQKVVKNDRMNCVSALLYYWAGALAKGDPKRIACFPAFASISLYGLAKSIIEVNKV